MKMIDRCKVCGGYAYASLDWYPECEPGATGTMYKVHCIECGVTVTAPKKNQAIERWNAMTKEELEARLQEQLDAGAITEEEAEMEWQDYTHRDEVWQEW